MSFLIGYISVCILFNCIISQNSQDDKLIFILNNETHEITLKDIFMAEEFRERILEEKEITISMEYEKTHGFLKALYNPKNFPKLETFKSEGKINCNTSDILGCNNFLAIATRSFQISNCIVIGSYNGILNNLVYDMSYNITFKVEEIQETDITKDDDTIKPIEYIKEVIIFSSIITLLLIYYLLLLC